MGGTCSKSNHHNNAEECDLDVSRHVVATKESLSKSKNKQQEQKQKQNHVEVEVEAAKTTSTTNMTGQSAAGAGNSDSVPVPTTTTTTTNTTKEDELQFFDAFQSFTDLNRKYSYPPATKMQARGGNVCIETDPGTLLKSPDLNSNSNSKSSTTTPAEVTATDTDATTTSTQQQQQQQKPPNKQIRKSTIAIKRSLTGPMAGVTTRGYPGELNEDELKACFEFRDQLKLRDPAFGEMVRAYAPAETEAFALCRFLRAREFNVDAVFAMLEENKAIEVWKEVREHNYYRDAFEKEYGCPVSVFMALYPVVVSGLAKNGATMFYFKPGNMDMNGLQCVAHVADLLPMLWDLLHNKGTDSMLRETKCHDPETTTVLAERIILMDLKGIPSALFDREFFGICGKIVGCFPETMNRTYMVNVPMTFQVVWAVAKMFMDARTLRKIGFFSYASKATEDLLQFVDKEELLSTYGGNGPSFEEVMKHRQTEYDKDCCGDNNDNNNNNNNTSRYIIETLTVTKYESKMTFDLKPNEIVSSIKIYSKGDNGADFTVTTDDSTNADGSSAAVLVEPTTVSREEAGSDKIHYSVELLLLLLLDDGDSSTKIPSGPGNWTVLAKGSAKEFYLVTIHIICPC